jgi:hypothetical protein
MVSLLFAAAVARASSGDPPVRPDDWATAVDGTCVGNLYRIEDGFFRGAQPTVAGFQDLENNLGVRCVLDLAGGPGDIHLVPEGSIKLFHVPMSAWGLHDDLVVQALRIMVDPANRPLMVHCQHGADRTGALVALYRIVVQGWSKEKAVLEMNQGGYHHNALWRNLDRYVLKADVAALRKELGLEAPISAPSDGGAPAIASLEASPLFPILILP